MRAFLACLRSLLRRFGEWLDEGDPEPDQDEGVGWLGASLDIRYPMG